MHKIEKKIDNSKNPNVPKEQEVAVPQTQSQQPMEKEKGFVESKLEQMATIPERYLEKTQFHQMESDLKQEEIRFNKEQKEHNAMLKKIMPDSMKGDFDLKEEE